MHALSIPTWIIHISSVIEWIAAIWFIWRYGEVTKNRAWWGLSFAMLPALVSAMCACTWHFFDNPMSLQWLVTLQATMTVVGNVTLLIAAWYIWRTVKPVNCFAEVKSSATLRTPHPPRKRELRSWGLPKWRKFAREVHQESHKSEVKD